MRTSNRGVKKGERDEKHNKKNGQGIKENAESIDIETVNKQQTTEKFTEVKKQDTGKAIRMEKPTMKKEEMKNEKIDSQMVVGKEDKNIVWKMVYINEKGE